MPVFISYSHADKRFVDLLAAQLVRHKVSVWIDRWELHVGDSLIDNLERAISGASALLVVLSKASVKSDWCKREINSGLIRELEERRIIVLPALIQKCAIPLFLRDKIYADFRDNFDDGLTTVLEAVARVANDSLGRTDAPEGHTDWAIDWTKIDGLLSLRLTMVEQALDQPYTVLSTVDILANNKFTEDYDPAPEDDQKQMRLKVVGMLAEAGTDARFTLLLEDQFARGALLEMRDRNAGHEFAVHLSARRLGQDTGRDVVFHAGQQIAQVHAQMMGVLTSPSRAQAPRRARKTRPPKKGKTRQGQ